MTFYIGVKESLCISLGSLLAYIGVKVRCGLDALQKIKIYFALQVSMELCLILDPISFGRLTKLAKTVSMV